MNRVPSRTATWAAHYILLILGLGACSSELDQRRNHLQSAWDQSSSSATETKDAFPTKATAEPSASASTTFEESNTQQVEEPKSTFSASKPIVATQHEAKVQSPHSFRHRGIYAGENLDRAVYIAEVLRKNPTIEMARQAWRGTMNREDQLSAWKDPMLEYAMAPLSIGSNQVDYGQIITLSQSIPWPGKTSLRAEVAIAEAESAMEDYKTVQRNLSLIASSLFDEYYTIARSLELNQQHQELLSNIKKSAEAQYATGRGSAQEALQVEIELAHVAHEQLTLESRRSVIIAQMNGLMRRAPEAQLPSPPQNLDPDLRSVDSSSALRAQAHKNRAELRSVEAVIHGKNSQIDMMDRESYPDIGVMASYNSMWAMTEHQWMIGVSAAIPLQLAARKAGVEEARAAKAQSEAALHSLQDNIAVEVEKARQGVIEAQHIVHLFRERLLPAAKTQIELAQIAYSTGQNSFQALIDAERSLRKVELTYEESLAELSRRWAELARSTGSIADLDVRSSAR